MKKIFAFLVLLLMLTSAVAQTTFTVDGINYITTSTSTVEITSGGTYTGNITIPSTVLYLGVTYAVTSIGYQAFSYGPGLTSIIIPSSVTYIETYSIDCAGLTAFIVDATNANYCTQDGVLFNKDKSSLLRYPAAKTGSYTIPSAVITIDFKAFYKCIALTSITIPNTVISIQTDAIRGCTGLTSITIPSSVTLIDSNNFMECYSLATINVETANTNYSSQDGVLFNKVKTILIRYPSGRAGSYSIPTSVTSVMGFSFTNSIIKSITFPFSITSIGACTFSGCSNLTFLSIPSSVTSIGSQAFAVCSNLDSVAVYATLPPTLSSDAFYGIGPDVTFYVPDPSLETYKNANVWKNFTNLLGLSQLVFRTIEVPAYIPTNGLVGWWPFNGNANDESGNGHNGITYGTVQTNDRYSNLNGAFTFDGIDDYIDLGNWFNFSDFSISLWINPNVQKGNATIIDNNAWGNINWICEAISDYQLNGYNFRNSSTFYPPTNQWSHLILESFGGHILVYLNNILVSTKSEVINYGRPVSLNLGRWICDNTRFWKGTMDEVGIWDRALSQQEISALFNASGKTVSTDSLIVASGKSFSYPISAPSMSANDSIDSYQFVLTYDTTKLEYVDFATANTLSSNGIGQVNSSIKGKLKVGFIDNGYMNGSGELLKLYFKAINAGETTPAISDFLYNTDTIKNISNGTISIFTRYGDADGNDYVQAHDAALVLKYSVGLDPIPSIDPIPWSGWRVEASDVDGNDTLTANDAGLILQRSIDLISSFPVERLGAILRSASANVPDVTITKEGNNLVFRSYGDLIGLNVSLIDKYSALGAPQFLDNNMMRATNINSNTYKIGLATAASPGDGSTFMTIPIIDATASEITIKMYVNTTEKIIRANIATGVMSVSDNMIEVYPNPIKDNLTIDFGSMTNCTLRITNLLGQTVYSSQVHSQKMDIDMSKIASSGLYYLQVIDNQKNVIATKKLLKK